MKKALLPFASFYSNISFVFEKAVEIPASTSGAYTEKRIKNATKLLPLLGLILGLLLFMPTNAAAQTPVNVCSGETATFTSKLPNYAYQARWLIKYTNDPSWYILSNYNGNYGDNIWYEYFNTPTSYNGYQLVAQYYYNGWYDIPNSYYRLTVNSLPAAPTTTGGSRVGSGTVTLSASGTGTSYRWYTVSTGGAPLSGATTATFTTPVLQTSTTYYVATVSTQGCESARRAVTATINPLTDNAVASPKVIIYHENFNSYANGQIAVGFTSENSTNPHWLTDPKADFIASNSAQASGGRFLRTARNYGTVTNRTLYFNNAVSTLRYENIKIIWTQRQTYSSASKPILSYSTDGGASWTEVTGWQTNTTLDANWRLVNGGSYITLPAGAANAATLRFRWVIPTHPAGDDFYALDDITITGTPSTGLSTFAWSSLALGTKPISNSAANPAAYTVDGVNMKWTAPAHQVNVTKEGVYNNEFQAPAYTYTLIQETATATIGTKTVLNLDKTVEDLTFTLLDIDRDVDQFRDKLIIKGYNGTTLVPLNKHQVVHTSYNETRLSNHIISGTAAGLEAPAASKEGNVTITFGSAVDRVEIEYYNEEGFRNFNGRQGFAMHDISWRKHVTVTPMPVKLISFKASLQNNTARLVWSTAMEKNNDKFVVERSQDGNTFKAIGEVKGNGNSSTKLNYSFTDADLLPGTNYYRLRQLDLDGTPSLTSVVTIEYNNFERIATTGDWAELYPTATSDVVHIKLNSTSGSVTINVADVSGKLVERVNGTALQTINLPVQHLKAGLYVVTIADGQQKQTLKFIKL